MILPLEKGNYQDLIVLVSYIEYYVRVPQLLPQIFSANIQLLEGRRKQHLSEFCVPRYFITITFSDFHDNPKILVSSNRDGS